MERSVSQPALQAPADAEVNPFWSDRVQEDVAVEQARPETLPVPFDEAWSEAGDRASGMDSQEKMNEDSPIVGEGQELAKLAVQEPRSKSRIDPGAFREELRR